MMDSLFFAGFDPLHEVPEVCTLCSARPPVFSFDYRALAANGESQRTTGFCCTACAAALLRKLERAESGEWAEEEAALAQDDFDVSEFHKHRLAAFPGSGRK
ncbi:MAG TPA: hypothetical protein VMH85_10455 [Terriglobales bacterium]|nr:hypothetical protein [Terriglobales bacterium]